MHKGLPASSHITNSLISGETEFLGTKQDPPLKSVVLPRSLPTSGSVQGARTSGSTVKAQFPSIDESQADLSPQKREFIQAPSLFHSNSMSSVHPRLECQQPSQRKLHLSKDTSVASEASNTPRHRDRHVEIVKPVGVAAVKKGLLNFIDGWSILNVEIFIADCSVVQTGGFLR